LNIKNFVFGISIFAKLSMAYFLVHCRRNLMLWFFILNLFRFQLKSDKIELAVQLESSKLESAELAQCKERQAAQFGLQEKEYFGEIENLKDRLAELPRGFEEEKKQLEEHWRLKFVRTL
jgi:hypothetical protein